jgi:hypothetical protein
VSFGETSTYTLAPQPKQQQQCRQQNFQVKNQNHQYRTTSKTNHQIKKTEERGSTNFHSRGHGGIDTPIPKYNQELMCPKNRTPVGTKWGV